MNNNLSTPEDFLLDDAFIQYCTGLDKELVDRWDNWMAANPHKAEAVGEAKRVFAMICGHHGNIELEARKFGHLLDAHIKSESGTVVLPAQKTGRIQYIFRLAGSAAAILVVCAGVYFWYSRNNKNQTFNPAQAVVKTNVKDALPARSTAKLVMGDGAVVDLDSLKPGQLVEKDGTAFKKSQGRLVYAGSKQSTDAILFNTLSTPRGGEYQLILPDGSKVWLNAASSIRFPVNFTEKTRTVYLTGEAYFEVSKNPHQPFHVQISNGMQVEVLGTQFNIMDYDDESAVKTTLLEGKVKMIQKGTSINLLPSQQAVFRKKSQLLAVEEADVDKAIAWKTGNFQFDEDDLPTILRQLSRWYDVQIAWTGPLPDKHYSGIVSKKLTLIQLLEIMKLAGIRYFVEDKKLIIQKI